MSGTEAAGGGEDFFALAKALGKFKAVQLAGKPSDRTLAKAAGVSATTIGNWLQGHRFPQEIGKVLLVLKLVQAAAAARGIAVPDGGIAGLLDDQRWREAHWDEARRRASEVSEAVQRAQAVQLLAGPPVGWPLAEVSDPFALEVHRPVQPDTPQPDLPVLPEYVPREHDAELRRIVAAAAAGNSRIAVLVGGSSTGKTRACWEALRLLREQPEPWRLWHPIDPSRPEAALRDLPAIRPRTVIWLNEAQFYLDAPGGFGEQVAAGLRELLRSPARGPVLVLATLWRSFWDAVTSRPAAGNDPHAQASELLAGCDITVPDAFTPAQLHALSQASDVRLVRAGEGAPDGQVIQFLAGAPELLARYRNAPAAAKAVIHAAMDGRRLGMRPALPHGFLETAVSGYLTDTEWDQLADDWLELALAYTAKPCRAARGPLIRIRPRLDPEDSSLVSRGPAYRLADYLDQHSRRSRDAQIPPASFWTAVLRYANPGDLALLGHAAQSRGLYQNAAQLYKRAIAHGSSTAGRDLLDLMRRLHPDDRRPVRWIVSHAPLNDAYRVTELLKALRDAGATGQVTTLANRIARSPLGDLRTVVQLIDALHAANRRKQAAVLADRAARADHLPLENPIVVTSLLKTLREAGAADSVSALLARKPAGYASLEDSFSSGPRQLLRELQDSGATGQVTTLASRIAHAPIRDPVDVVWLLYALLEASATSQAATLANRAAAHAPLDDLYGLAVLLNGLDEVGGTSQATKLANRAAAHAPLDYLHDISDLLNALRHAGATGQITTLADRIAAHVPLDAPDNLAKVLNALREAGATGQVITLADRIAAYLPLDDPDNVAEVLNALREAGATGQVITLANRAAAHVPLGHPGGVGDLLAALNMRGDFAVSEQVTTLLARNPASHASLERPTAAARLLWVLHSAGASDQVSTLANRVAADLPLDDLYDVVGMIGELRDLGATQQATTLASRAAAHAPLHDPGDVGGLLYKLRQSDATDQVAILLARNPASHASLEDSNGLHRLLRELRDNGAVGQVTSLANRIAAQVLFDHPISLAQLLSALEESGATSQVTTLLARNPAAYLTLDILPGDLVGLLIHLRMMGAADQVATMANRIVAHTFPHDQWPHRGTVSNDVEARLWVLRYCRLQEQAEALIDQLPARGMFGFYCEEKGCEKEYRFGRETDGSATSCWSWEDLA